MLEQKRGAGNKDFKKWGQTSSGGSCLKKGVGIPLQTMTKYPANSEGTICRYSTKMVFLKTLVFSCEFCAIFQNQATKFGQLIEREKYFSSKIMLKIMSGD